METVTTIQALVTLGVTACQAAQEAQVIAEDCKELGNLINRTAAHLCTLTMQIMAHNSPTLLDSLKALQDSMHHGVAVIEKCGSAHWLTLTIYAGQHRATFTSVSMALSKNLTSIPLGDLQALSFQHADINQLHSDLTAAQFKGLELLEGQATRLQDMLRTGQPLQRETVMAVKQLLTEIRSGLQLAATEQDDDLEVHIAELKAELAAIESGKAEVETQGMKDVISLLEACQAVDSNHEDVAALFALKSLLCPISQELMSDPVILAESGHTYERGEIQTWLKKGGRSDPLTGAALQQWPPVLIPNHAVRQTVQEYISKQPGKGGASTSGNQRDLALHDQTGPSRHGSTSQAASGSGGHLGQIGQSTTQHKPIGVPELVQLLDDANAAVQEHAAAALWNLATENMEHSTVAIAKMGAIPKLTRLLDTNNSDVQAKAAAALRALAFNADNRVTIAKMEAIPKLAHLLDSSIVAVQEQAAAAIRALACNSDNRVVIARWGSIPKLVKLLDSSNEAVQEQAAAALNNLALNVGNQVTIAIMGAIPKLTQLLLCSNTAVQEQAAAAIWNLACNDENKETIAKMGAVPNLVQLLEHSDTRLQQKAAGALKVLACNAENKVAIAGAGTIPKLMQLLECTNTAVQEQAAWAINNLAAQNASNSLTIAHAGAIPRLILLLGSRCAAVQEAAVQALWNIAVYKKSRTIIINDIDSYSLLDSIHRSRKRGLVSAFAANAADELLTHHSVWGWHYAW